MLAVEVKSMARQTAREPARRDPAQPANEVLLRGRVTSAPLERELPSGDTILTFRVSVIRREADRRGRQGSDWVDCVAWAARPRRTVARWTVGDPVEVGGALRRRFYRTGEQRGTRLEVEVLRGRRVRDGPD
jgi:single-strand DNA-binding protein